MSFAKDDIVRQKGQRGTFRVHRVTGESVDCFGGPLHQWRTLLADTLRMATKREAATFVRTETIIKEALPKAHTRARGRR